MRLKDKVAILTGANSGIGDAASKLFAEEGARVVLSATWKDALALVASQIRDLRGDAL